LALLGRLPSARVDGGVMQASEKPAQSRNLHNCRHVANLEPSQSLSLGDG